MKRILALLLTLCLICTMGIGAFAAEGDVVILYTNDVHSYLNYEVDGEGNVTATGLTYAHVAALKDELGAVLVDAGDHIQGSVYGAMDNGTTVIKLMNAADYDVATLGNHEFDYGMERALNLMDEADFPYVSCNFKDLKTNDTVLDSYTLVKNGGKTIAFVGITTPETLTKAAPAYFQDAEGNWIYDILGSDAAADLYSATQSAIDAAIAAGADYVIALGHLGDDPSSAPWTSEDVIANTTGLNAFIDGHSHSVVEGKNVTDKAGKTVVLTQTGEYLKAIGKMVISADGTVTTSLIKEAENIDTNVDDPAKVWVKSVDEQLGETIAYSEVKLYDYDDDGNRLVRRVETNLGDFVADSYYYYFNEVLDNNCDIAFSNGGGLRATGPVGEWSYKTLKQINPYGNMLCLLEMSGQTILDALEWGARATDLTMACEQIGGFLSVAGLSFEIDVDVESTVQGTDAWEGAPTGEYRVKNVKVYNKETGKYEPLNLNKKYTVAGNNFMLTNGGDGYNMFSGNYETVVDFCIEDYMALATYAKSFDDTDSDEYANINTANSPLAAYEGYLLDYENMYGAGRITAHEHDLEWVICKYPTLISEGAGHYECECGYQTEDEVIPAITPDDSEKDNVIIDGRKDDESNPNTGASVSALAVLLVAAGAVIASRKK